MNISLLGDPLLLTIMAMAGFVSMATSLQVATRPAAVSTRQVMTALTMGQLVFIVTRFGNMFYLPLLGNYVDQATRVGNTDTLVQQMQWVVVGAAAGALVAFFLLPTFIELCCLGVYSVLHRGMLRALLNFARSRTAWAKAFRALRPPSMMGTKLFKLDGVPWGFLIFNILASAIWTVGALAAITVSGLNPHLKQTAILLSGLVNSFAAIAFSVWVDPQAAIITDQARSDERPASHVLTTAFHLVLGNFAGCILGLLVLGPAVSAIGHAARGIGAGVGGVDAAMIWLIAGNAAIWLLAGTIYSSRVSAVRTAKAATAVAIFNFFSLIARVATQVYAPFVGAVTDQLTHRPSGVALEAEALDRLEQFYRNLLWGSAAGCILSVLLLPTFVRVYVVMIDSLLRRGSLPAVLMQALNPLKWPRILSLFSPPWKQMVSRSALAKLPKAFLWANVIVLSCQTVSQLAAIYAGATFAPEVARTTTLLSPLINGVATIALSLIVDPTTSVIVDQAVEGKRPLEEIETMTFWLAMGAVAGTLVAQLLFIPAAWVISNGAQLLDTLL